VTSAASLTLILGACSEVREIPVTDLRPFKPISSSCVDTAETRKEIRAHNSVLDSLKTGRKVVYEDPCKDVKPTS
jgi:hypothetical protein